MLEGDLSGITAAAVLPNVRVVDESEVEDDLVRDMTDALTSSCVRLFGKRAARYRSKKALAAAAGEGA
jgi:predicted site-specific integrase-resolvase